MTPLLDSLRAEREKHFRVGNEKYGHFCDYCGIEWFCSEARALDVAIAGAMLHHTSDHGRIKHCDNCGEAWPCATYAAMSNAWEFK